MGDHPFSQRDKATKRAVWWRLGGGLDIFEKGGSRQYRRLRILCQLCIMINKNNEHTLKVLEVTTILVT